MIPIDFLQANGELTSPMLQPLPVFVTAEYVTSMWRPSDEELEAINAGAAIQLSIFTHAQTHPPVSVDVSAVPILEEGEGTDSSR